LTVPRSAHDPRHHVRVPVERESCGGPAWRLLEPAVVPRAVLRDRDDDGRDDDGPSTSAGIQNADHRALRVVTFSRRILASIDHNSETAADSVRRWLDSWRVDSCVYVVSARARIRDKSPPDS